MSEVQARKSVQEEVGEPKNQVAADIASIISAVSFQGLSVTTPDGEPATLAVIDQQGRVIDAGSSVMRAVWDVAIQSYRNFLRAQGYVRVRTASNDEHKT